MLDYEYLWDISDATYEEIMMAEENLRKNRVGLFGHREERMDEVFASVDNFLQ